VTSAICIAAIQEAAQRNRGRISESDYQAMIRVGASAGGRSWPWPSTILARLRVRTWNEALSAADIPPCSQNSGTRGVPDAVLTRLATDLARQLGRSPTPSEFTNSAKVHKIPGVQSVKRRFGSWKAFIAAATET
jgi:hypothetical protein